MLTLLGVAAVWADGGPDGELAAPLCLHAAGKPIDTKAVHAAPCVGDWNGDGRPDLLLGEAAGRLHLYRNAGSLGAPRLVDGGLVEAEGEPVHVPPG
jgi:hypothetical protein